MVIGRALLEKYTDLLATGWQLSKMMLQGM